MADISPSGLWIWATQKVSSLVPGWFAAMFFGQSAARPLYFDSKVNVLVRKKPGNVAPFHWLSKKAQEVKKHRRTMLVDAYFPESAFLKRAIEIPLSAKRNVSKIVELDMVRTTPFGTGEVYWTHSSPITEGGTTKVIQWVAKKTDIHQRAAILASHGITVRQVYVDAPNVSTAAAFLGDKHSAGTRLVRRANLGLAVVSGLFLLFAWLYPAWKTSSETKLLELETATLQAQALQLRTEVDSFRAVETSKTELLVLLRRRPRLSGVWRDLTVAMPDTAWSDNLVFSGARVVFSGTSKTSAAELVLELSKNNQFENPRLSGPVSKTSSGGERFEIAADLRLQ